MDDIIDNVEAYILTVPNEKRPHWVSLLKFPVPMNYLSA